MREPIPLPSRLLFIADASLAADPARHVAEAVAAGATFIEIRRERRADGAPESALRLEEIRRCMAAAGKARVIVNDRVDLALLSGAAGAHVGQDDLPVLAARRILGPDRILGLSTHDETQFASGTWLKERVRRSRLSTRISQRFRRCSTRLSSIPYPSYRGLQCLLLCYSGLDCRFLPQRFLFSLCGL